MTAYSSAVIFFGILIGHENEIKKMKKEEFLAKFLLF